MIWTVLGFLFCSAIIFYCGINIAKYGDIIAERTGLGKTWIGTFLVASVTSLPELFTGLGAVIPVDTPNIAIGNALGACVYNFLLLVILDSLHRERPLSSGASLGHIISVSLSTILLSILGLNLFLKDLIIPLGWISPTTLLIMFIYFLGLRLTYLYEKKTFSNKLEHITESFIKEKRYSLKRVLYLYGLNALAVVLVSFFLPRFGVSLAEETGLSQTFIGSIIISLTTTLPEVVVSISAVRFGAIDLALGNIFGSVFFNLFILAIDDLFYIKGALLNFGDPKHLNSIFFLIVMNMIFLASMTYRMEVKKFVLGLDSLLIIITFFIYVMLLYR